jgi:uncharacterized membrane protein YgaE (UPF0421/DUF939 family)
MAGAALALGMVSLAVWVTPLLGLPIAFCGIIVAVIAVTRAESRNKKSITGLVFSSLGFLLSIANIIIAWWTPVIY